MNNKTEFLTRAALTMAFLSLVGLAGALAQQQAPQDSLLYIIDVDGDNKLDISTNDAQMYDQAEKKGLARLVLPKRSYGEPFEYPAGSGVWYTFKNGWMIANKN